MSVASSHPHGIDALESWNLNAEFWDNGIGVGGNKYWSRLQEPCLERFLGEHLKRDDCQALDLATGNGLCARWLAERGAQVLATDGAVNMLERAKAHGSPGKKIEFRKIDVTLNDDFEALIKDGKTFDIILINMALQDIATLEPLAKAVPRLLRRDGVFVATLLHPVFMTSIYSRTAESKFSSETLDFEVTIGKSIFEYLDVAPWKGVALIGQAHPQLFFHRPMHELFAIFFRTGLVMDGLEEPCFTAEDASPDRLLSTEKYVQLPPILGFCLRAVGN